MPKFHLFEYTHCRGDVTRKWKAMEAETATGAILSSFFSEHEDDGDPGFPDFVKEITESVDNVDGNIAILDYDDTVMVAGSTKESVALAAIDLL